MKWEMVQLGELYDVHNGLSKGGKFFGSGYPFLTFSTVFNNFFLPNELASLVQSTEKEQEDYSILCGDVFVTRTSETSDELGMSCVALKDYPRATYNGFTKRLRPKTNRIFPEFIGYYMRMPQFRGEFQAFSTMTTRASLKNEDLLGLRVAVPPFDTQKRISGILRAYDDLIENNQKQIKLLEEAAQRLYKEWFVDLHFPGYETTKIVDGVPEGWRPVPLSEIANVIMGQSPKSEFYNNKKEGLPFHQGVGSYGARFVVDETYSTSFTRIAPAGSILFSVRAPVGRLNITRNKVVIGRGLAAMNHKQNLQSLDFTQNPLVALYFACYNNNDDEASVWIINEPAYRRVLMHDYTYISAQNSKMIISKIINDEIINQDYRPHNNDHYIQHPWIYKPVYREARMVSQSSVFMLWAAKRSSITSFISDEHYMSLQVSDSLREYGFICQITIPAQCKGNILHQLNSCGINEKFIYPGLDGVGKFIRNKYSNTR